MRDTDEDFEDAPAEKKPERENAPEDEWGKLSLTRKVAACAVFAGLIYATWLLVRWLMA